MIRLRPHHFLCTLAFRGRGYSDTFSANYREICDTVIRDPQTSITVVGGGDSVCSACPHQMETGLCRTQEIINILDDAHGRILDLSPGDIVTWQQGLEKLKKNMTLDQFHGACAPCRWKKMGICQDALMNLHQESNDEPIPPL